MDSRASTRMRVSVIPVFFALMLNIFMVAPAALAPSAALALTGSTVHATDGNLNIVTFADADPIDAGDEASFHIVIWNAGPEDALDAEFFDTLPTGLAWSFEVINDDLGDDACGSASGSVQGGPPPVQTISCDFGTLEPSDMPEAPFDRDSPGKVIRVWGDTDRGDCGLLENEAWTEASNHDRVVADDSIQVKCPTIALEKETDAVVVEPPESGGNPVALLPDTAAGLGPNGEPISVPVKLLVAFFLGSLGALALANARARSRRR